MENRTQSFMIGREPSLSMLLEIEMLARRHGFTLPDSGTHARWGQNTAYDPGRAADDI
jgi:hypothetical protein